MKNKTYFKTFVMVSVMVIYCASGLLGKKKYDIIIKNGTITGVFPGMVIYGRGYKK